MPTLRILVGIDGPEGWFGSRRALRGSIVKAAKGDTVIEAVTVWQSPSGSGDIREAHLDESKIEQAATERLEKTISDVADDQPAVKVDPVVLEGDPAMVFCPRSAGTDLLVVGSLGHNPASQFGAWLGGLAMRCAQHSSGAPVVIVPKGQ